MKLRFRYSRDGWRYVLRSTCELYDLRGLPGLNPVNCTIGPFSSLDAAYDGVRFRLRAA